MTEPREHPEPVERPEPTDRPGDPAARGVAPQRATEWIAGFAEALGLDPPDAATVEQLLDLAGVAAHASERVAAPIACYLVGRAGADLETAMRAAQEVAHR